MHQDFPHGTGPDADLRARAFMKKVVDAMAGPLACVRGYRYELPAGPCPGLRDVRDALRAALNVEVADVAYVSSAKLENGIVTLGARDFSRKLAAALEARYGFRLMLQLGHGRFQRLKAQLHYGTQVPLAVRLNDRTWLPREALQSAIFHLWAATFAKSEADVDALIPLVSLMGRAIPIGEFVGNRASWAVLIA